MSSGARSRRLKLGRARTRGAKGGKKCEFVICVDPDTGDAVVRARGDGCPDGWVQKERKRIEDAINKRKRVVFE